MVPHYFTHKTAPLFICMIKKEPAPSKRHQKANTL
jgi:hypothetical protein